MKIRMFLLVVFASTALASVWQWNDYYFGAKPGNYMATGVLYLCVSILFSFFFHWKGKPIQIVLVIFALINFLFPVIIHILLPSRQYIALTSFLFTLAISFFASQLFGRKTLLSSLPIVIVSVGLHVVLKRADPHSVSFLTLILFAILFAMEKGKGYRVRFAATAVGLVGFSAFYGLSHKEYFNQQSQIKEKIEDVYVEDGVRYVVTKVDGFRNIYKEDQLLHSTADIFMFYESFIHSAFQMKPDAKRVLYVGKSDFAIREIRKHNVVRLDHFVTPGSSPGRYDLIFVDTEELSDDRNRLVGESLRKGGLLVIRGRFSEEIPVSRFRKEFHVALPSLNEVVWEVDAAERSTFEQVTKLPPSLKTVWYTNETYDLISNQGKFLGITALRQ